MKRCRIEYVKHFSPGPMTFWVHRPVECDGWHEAESYEPPLPRVVAGRGYPRFYVEFDGFEFEFASLHELRRCIDVLEAPLLPTSRRLAEGSGSGPNSHWLSRLPARVKPWRYRERAVRYLRSALDDFEAQQF